MTIFIIHLLVSAALLLLVGRWSAGSKWEGQRPRFAVLSHWLSRTGS